MFMLILSYYNPFQRKKKVLVDVYVFFFVRGWSLCYGENFVVIWIFSIIIDSITTYRLFASI